MSQYTSAMNTNDGRSALISDIASANATVHAQQVRRCHVLSPWQQQAMHARDQKSAMKPSPLSATSCTGHVRWKTEGSTSMAMSQRTPSHCQGRQHVSDTKHKTQQHHTTHICMQAHMHKHIPCQICVRGCPASCCAAAASSNSTGPADAHSVRVPRQHRWSVTAHRIGPRREIGVPSMRHAMLPARIEEVRRSARGACFRPLQAPHTRYLSGPARAEACVRETAPTWITSPGSSVTQAWSHAT